MAIESTTSSAMNGGDELHSYSRNSAFQRNGVEAAKGMINESIAEHLDLKQLLSSSSSSSKVFRIADLGCSVGPNTFIAVQNITESVKLKHQSHSLNEDIPEFQVYFNDQTSNDFNTLFNSLPSDRQYFAAGVPGRFQGRLFPSSSLHFIHSSYALHWLSSAPKELMDKNSPAYNKGRIFYINAPSEVFEAYSAQFAKEMGSFLNARAQELVPGGLMAFILPCLPDGIPPSQWILIAMNELFEACLTEMVSKGIISEDKVDTFNCPVYHPTREELKVLIEKNGCFSIERMESLVSFSKMVVQFDFQVLVMHIRAASEGILSEHFGNDIVDELFDRLLKKLTESLLPHLSSYKHVVDLFVLLKRNINS